MKKKIKPGVIWITGLSGAGKTTLAKILYTKLNAKYSNIKLLDGDILRKKLKIQSKKSFTYASRKKIGLKFSEICKKYEKKNYLVIIAVMVLIKDVQIWNKNNFKNYLDIYLNVPLSVLKKRDTKKIYKKFFQKKISNVAGLDLEYDAPRKPYIKINWKKTLYANIVASKVLKKLFKTNFSNPKK